MVMVVVLGEPATGGFRYGNWGREHPGVHPWPRL